jgi:HKD family nuclease
MNITLLGQGFEATSQNSVGNHLIRFFADKDFHTFTGISAFASQAGIRGLSKHINTAKRHLNIITIVTGVDQKGTSREALEELLSLGINAFVFYQPGITIFHPKIYLFEGADKSELIIGSSNLTSQGLFTNIETSLLVTIDNSSEADRKIVEQLKSYFKSIFDFADPNLKKLSTKIIADLVKAKVVPTEAERKAAYDKEVKAERKETENIIS